MTVSGSMAAEKIGVPAISLMPTYANNEHFSLRTLLPADPSPEMAEAWAAMRGSLAEFAAEQGVGVPRMFDGPPAPFNIVFIPREFQPMAETFDDRFRFVGPCVGGQDDAGWSHEGTNPLLFISLGTTLLNRRPDFFRTCLEHSARESGTWPWRSASRPVRLRSGRFRRTSGCRRSFPSFRYFNRQMCSSRTRE
ncbi:uncharacterized UDP-glucosyltransferase YjiC [Arthrobacter sp. Hiyo6]|nr:uncharacterized UDP-glucosyltransferase YjiC [Arthrobacter sp. Hiyo6]